MRDACALRKKKRPKGRNATYRPVNVTRKGTADGDPSETGTTGDTNSQGDDDRSTLVTRWRLEQEIVQGEEKYLRHLQILEACYRIPMERKLAQLGYKCIHSPKNYQAIYPVFKINH